MSRRVDWQTMSHKLADALGGLVHEPDGRGAQEWALKMLDRYHEMRNDDNAATTLQASEEKK